MHGRRHDEMIGGVPARKVAVVGEARGSASPLTGRARAVRCWLGTPDQGLSGGTWAAGLSRVAFSSATSSTSTIIEIPVGVLRVSPI